MGANLQACVSPQEDLLIDESCELALINAMMNGEAYDPDTEMLTDDVFTLPVARAAFNAIRQLGMEGNKTIDVVNVYHKMGAMGNYQPQQSELQEIASLPPVFDLDRKVRILMELANRRQLVNISSNMLRMAQNPGADINAEVGGYLQQMEQLGENNLTHITTMKESTQALIEMVRRNVTDGTPQYSACGFDCFDSNAMLRPQALTVVAAHSGHGKSTLAMTIAYNVACHGEGVAYYSLEMTDIELAGRIAAHLCDVEPISILYGLRRPDDLLTRVRTAGDVLSALPIYFDDRATTTPEALCQSIRQMARAKKVKGVVVDYIQILVQRGRDKNQTEEAVLGAIVRQLKNIAKQENIWILLLSQLNRNHDQEEPTAGDLRGSGQILETADNCVMIWRPEKVGLRYRNENVSVDTKNTAQLHVVKARTGNDGVRVIVRYFADRAHFEQPQAPLPTIKETPKEDKNNKKHESYDDKNTANNNEPQIPFPS